MTSSPPSSASCSGADRLRSRALLALALLAAPPLAAQQPPQTALEAQAAADSAAGRWFAALASGAYAGSWQMASALFRTRIREQDWMLLASSYRDQFARGDRRRLVESRYQQVVPPQEPGEYVTLRYLTDVTPERRVSETLVLRRDPEGAWRVADYLLWPNPNGDPVLWAPAPPRLPNPAEPPPPPSRNVARPRR